MKCSGTMFGCDSWAIVSASRRNRSSTECDAMTSGDSTFTASLRFRLTSRTRNTTAKPPAPSFPSPAYPSPSAGCRRVRTAASRARTADARPAHRSRMSWAPWSSYRPRPISSGLRFDAELPQPSLYAAIVRILDEHRAQPRNAGVLVTLGDVRLGDLEVDLHGVGIELLVQH